MEGKRKAAQLLFQNLLQKSRKRQRKEVEEFEELYSSIDDSGDDDDDDNGELMGTGGMEERFQDFKISDSTKRVVVVGICKWKLG